MSFYWGSEIPQKLLCVMRVFESSNETRNLAKTKQSPASRICFDWSVPKCILNGLEKCLCSDKSALLPAHSFKKNKQKKQHLWWYGVASVDPLKVPAGLMNRARCLFQGISVVRRDKKETFCSWQQFGFRVKERTDLLMSRCVAPTGKDLNIMRRKIYQQRPLTREKWMSFIKQRRKRMIKNLKQFSQARASWESYTRKAEPSWVCSVYLILSWRSFLEK